MKTFILIDSHALIHRFFHALPPLTTPSGEPIQAVYGLSNIILRIHREMKPDYIAAAFDRPEETFRHKEFDGYKIHRPPAADELVAQFKSARKLFDVFNIRLAEMPGFEADDVIGSLVERFRREPDLKISIVSGDLDLLQLVEDEKVVVQFLKKGMSETLEYNQAAVRERYGLEPHQLPDLKGLLGDASDNIPGVKGVGPKGAQPLIQKYGTLENLLEHLWEVPDKVGMKIEAEKDIAILSKKLATIRRDVPIIGGLEDYRLPVLDVATTRAHFEQLGFKSLAARL